MYSELYLIAVFFLLTLSFVGGGLLFRRQRRTVLLVTGIAWLTAPIVFLAWNGETASAQTVACGISQLTSGQASTASINAAISDDGTHIALAVARNPTGGNADLSQEIFIYNIGTASFTQVTNSTGGVTREVSISADGSRVAFISTRNLTGGNADLNTEVFLYDSGTTAITQVTNTTLDVPPGSGRQYAPSISGDGSRIAFLSSSNLTGGNSNHNGQYFIYEITTGNFIQLTDSTIAHPAPFTPIGINTTGTEVNFLHTANLNGQNPDGNLELFRWHFQDMIHHMTVTTGSGFESFTSPSMNSTGSLYAFSSIHNLNGTNPGGDHEIFLLQGGVFTAITEGNGTWLRKTWPDLSANGTHIAFQGDTRIVRYDIAANEFTTIPATFPGPAISGSRGPSISADGSRIAFFSDYDLTGGNPFNHNEVYLASCTTATPTPTPTPSTVYTVNEPDDNGDGVCDSTCTLRDGIVAANFDPQDNIITFAPDLTTITLDDEVTIDQSAGQLIINGLGADRFAIDGGPGTNRIFYTFLSGSFGSELHINDVTLTGGNGGGAFANGEGGAIYGNAPLLKLFRVHVTGNSAVSGGGIGYNSSGLTMFGTTFSNNTASGDCGGFFNRGDGLQIVNSTISGNSAGGDGGGFCNNTSSGSLSFVTVTNNSAAINGGGIAQGPVSGILNVGNSIIAGNGAGGDGNEIYRSSPPAMFVSDGYNLVGDELGDSTNTGAPITYQTTDIRETPPQLVPLGNYGGTTPTHALQYGSPARDAGDPLNGKQLDQRGFGRINDPDIGAFEVQDFRYYVTQAADAPPGGPCDADCSLREALHLADSTGGTVEFARIFTAATPITIADSPAGINADVTIAGYSAKDVVIQAAPGFSVFSVNAGNVTISDVTLTGGGGFPNGGGGIYVGGGSLTVNRVQITGNATGIGNGFGGGMRIAGGTDHRILNSTFSFNQTPTSGCGGISHITGTLAIANSTFTGNAANATFGGGGAICVTGGDATLRNVTTSGNTASTGGGIYHAGGTIDIANSIVAGNSASGSNPPEINTIGGGAFTSSGNNLIGDSAGDAANTGNPIAWGPLDFIDVPPILGPLQDNGGTTLTMELLSGSIAIDSGSNVLAVDPSNNSPLLTDQRGFTRVIGSVVDIGAYESMSGIPPPPPTPTPTPTATPTATPTPTLTPTPAPGTPKIAFTSQRLGNTNDVYVMDVNGANQTRLTTTLGDDQEPVWSPDGTKIAFESERDGNYEIYVMNADGSNQTRLTFYNGLDYGPAWSPDGTKIAFTRGPGLSSDTRWIMVMNANGSNVTILTPTNSVWSDNPSWSPDGTKIVFARQLSSPSTKDIYVVNTDGSNGPNPVRLTNNFPVFDDHPAWSPDGSRIAFTSDRDDPGNWEIYVMNADGTGVTRLTNGPAGTFSGDLYPAWSPDSGQILFNTNRDGAYEVYVMNADGAYQTNISNNVAHDSQPAWQPNVAWSVPTSTGSNVNVLMGLVSVTYSSVTQPGTTTQHYIDPASAGPLPAGFTLGPGYPAYDISTTAIYTPPIIICIQVPAVSNPVEFASLALFHYENGALRDRTSSRDFASRSICASVNSLSPFVVARNLAPTAALVSVSGRVTVGHGRGLPNAAVSLTDQSGALRTARTNAFGYYRFIGVAADRTYIAAVVSKRYQFEPRAVAVTAEITDLNFTAKEE